MDPGCTGLDPGVHGHRRLVDDPAKGDGVGSGRAGASANVDGGIRASDRSPGRNGCERGGILPRALRGTPRAVETLPVAPQHCGLPGSGSFGHRRPPPSHRATSHVMSSHVMSSTVGTASRLRGAHPSTFGHGDLAPFGPHGSPGAGSTSTPSETNAPSRSGMPSFRLRDWDARHSAARLQGRRGGGSDVRTHVGLPTRASLATPSRSVRRNEGTGRDRAQVFEDPRVRGTGRGVVSLSQGSRRWQAAQPERCSHRAVSPGPMTSTRSTWGPGLPTSALTEW